MPSLLLSHVLVSLQEQKSHSFHLFLLQNSFLVSSAIAWDKTNARATHLFIAILSGTFFFFAQFKQRFITPVFSKVFKRLV